MGSEYDPDSEYSKLAKVHSAPIRTTQPSFHSLLFQPVPKLYKYSADQVQIVFHRKGQDEQSTVSLKPDNSNPDEKTSKRTKKHSKVQRNMENKIDLLEEKCADVKNIGNSCDMPNSLNLENKTPEMTPSTSIESSPSKSTSNSECNYCEDFIAQLENVQVELGRLTQLLEAKTRELANVQTENKTLRMENKRLSNSIEGVKNGMRQLSSSVEASNQSVNEAKIMHLLHTASPSLDGEASFRRMSLNMKDIRGRINKMNSTVPGTGTPDKKNEPNPNDISSLKKIKSPLRSISIFY